MNEWTSAPDRWCARACAELLVSATQGENVVVVRTVTGGAPMLASAFDAAALEPVLGTVAGNDTVLLITRTPDQAERLVESLLTAARGTITVPALPAPDPTSALSTATSPIRASRVASPDRTRV